MRGIKIPFDVETTSRSDEGSGDVVPMPAAPVVGKVFVCENVLLVVNMKPIAKKSFAKKESCVFIVGNFIEEIKECKS